MSNPYFDNPTVAFLPSKEPTLLSRSLKTSGLITIVSPVLLLSTFKYPLTNELDKEELTTPLSICVEKVSLDTNFNSPFIWAETFLVLLMSIKIFSSSAINSSLSVSI